MQTGEVKLKGQRLDGLATATELALRATTFKTFRAETVRYGQLREVQKADEASGFTRTILMSPETAAPEKKALEAELRTALGSFVDAERDCVEWGRIYLIGGPQPPTKIGTLATFLVMAAARLARHRSGNRPGQRMVEHRKNEVRNRGAAERCQSRTEESMRSRERDFHHNSRPGPDQDRRPAVRYDGRTDGGTRRKPLLHEPNNRREQGGGSANHEGKMHRRAGVV